MHVAKGQSIAQYSSLLIQYLNPKAKAQQAPLSAIKKLWDNAGDCCHKLIQQSVIGHNFVLDCFPDRCAD